MKYYVVDPSGQKYGPADIATLQTWAREGRVTGHTVLEVQGTGQRTSAAEVLGHGTFAEQPAFGQRPGGGAFGEQVPQMVQPGGGALPYALQGKFNWGAFLMGWIWGLNHKAYITLLQIPNRRPGGIYPVRARGHRPSLQHLGRVQGLRMGVAERALSNGGALPRGAAHLDALGHRLADRGHRPGVRRRDLVGYAGGCRNAPVTLLGPFLGTGARQRRRSECAYPGTAPGAGAIIPTAQFSECLESRSTAPRRLVARRPAPVRAAVFATC